MDKRITRKTLSSLAALLIICIVSGGCAKKDAASASAGKAASGGEPYTVNFYYRVAQEGADQGLVDQAVNDLAMKELNMKVSLTPLTAGAYNQQLPMVLASGSPLDIFTSFSNFYPSYIESQYIINCADYLDEFKDAIAVLGDDALVAYVGDFLVGFGQMKERAYPAGLVCRKDIFDELGFKVSDFSVNTDDYSSFDQVTKLFASVKKAYPQMTVFDGTSVMGRQTGSYFDGMGNNFGVLENYGQTTKFTNWFESEQYLNFCRIGKEWFTKGYSSKDIAVNRDSGELKMRAGNCFSYITNVKPNTNIEKLAQTGYEVVVVPLSKAMKYTYAVAGGVFSIANAAKDKRKAAQFLNWTYKSGEFNDLINWGIKGKDWVVTADGMAAYPPGVTAQNVGYHNDWGFAYPNQFAGHPWVGNPPDIWEQYRKYNAGLLTSKSFGCLFDAMPVATEIAQLNAVYAKYEYDLPFGTVKDVNAALKEFNQELYAAGLQKVIDEKQKQLDAWLAKQK